MENPYRAPQPLHRGPDPLAGTPAVVTWYRIYAVAMALLYLLLIVVGAALAAFSGQIADEKNPAELFLIEGIVFALIGIPLAAMYIVGVFAPVKSWAWVYGIVLIGIGMTSCCCLPATIPLLVFWFRPETQGYFGRPVRGAGPAGV